MKSKKSTRPIKTDSSITLVESAKAFLTKSKVGRFVNSYINKQPDRKGHCTPDVCETLDGRKGAACCKLGYRCPALCETACGVYKIRPRNCRVFPANEEDLKLVRNCGYYFGDKKKSV